MLNVVAKKSVFVARCFDLINKPLYDSSKEAHKSAKQRLFFSKAEVAHCVTLFPTPYFSICFLVTFNYRGGSHCALPVLFGKSCPL